LEKEHKNALPKAARYPLFLIGLVILILGGLAGIYAGVSAGTEAGVAAVGFVFLLLSVVLR
jgi:TRAP-type C4-dicarboxylate transport system permease large subunit